MLQSLNVWKVIIKKKKEFTVSLKFNFDIHIIVQW